MEKNLIAIIDDTDMVREIIEDTIKAGGYENIVSYASPVQAYTDLKESQNLALVISDYEMPEMNGTELLDKIKVLHPHVSGIIVTGNAQVVATLKGKYPVLQKGQCDFMTKLLDLVELSLKTGGMS